MVPEGWLAFQEVRTRNDSLQSARAFSADISLSPLLIQESSNDPIPRYEWQLHFLLFHHKQEGPGGKQNNLLTTSWSWPHSVSDNKMEINWLFFLMMTFNLDSGEKTQDCMVADTPQHIASSPFCSLERTSAKGEQVGKGANIWGQLLFVGPPNKCSSR